MVAVIAQSRIVGSAHVDRTAVPDTSSATNAVDATGVGGTTSSFELLILQQMSTPLPTFSFERQGTATAKNETSKLHPANESDPHSVKPKTDENTTAINLFFIPNIIHRESLPAKTADAPSGTFGRFGEQSATQKDQTSTPNDSTPTAQGLSKSAISRLFTTEPVKAPDLSQAAPAHSTIEKPENVLPDLNPDTSVGSAEMKTFQHGVANQFSIVNLQRTTDFVQPVTPSSVLPCDVTNSDMQITAVEKSNAESAIAPSTTIQELQSTQLDGGQSGASQNGGSGDEPTHLHIQNDTGNPAASTLVSNIVSLNAFQDSSGKSSTTISNQLSTAIVNGLDKSRGEGSTTVRIRLEREELGKVDLHLTVRNGVVSIRISADDQVTQQLINGQIDELRESLNLRGVNCGEMQLAGQSSGQHSAGQKESRPETIRVVPTTMRTLRQQVSIPSSSRSTNLLNYVA